MPTLEEVQEVLKEYTKNPSFVFKKCQNSIVVLKKLEDTITNELRSVANKKYAKFRGNKFYVEKIIDLITLEDKIQTNNSIHEDKSITYIVGNIIEEKEYDTKLDRVYGKGIHYFLILERAYYYYIDISNYNGKYSDWDEDGQNREMINYKDGKRNGKCVLWREDGQKYKECDYKEDIYHGKYEEWYTNGIKRLDCNYKEGKLDGKYEEWYFTGKKKKECNYKEDVYDGKYEEWYDNGKSKLICFYKNDKYDGKYQEFYKNGSMKLICHYENGKRGRRFERGFENGEKRVESDGSDCD